MGRRTGEQKPVAGVQEESGFQKAVKNKRHQEENLLLSAQLAKYFKRVKPNTGSQIELSVESESSLNDLSIPNSEQPDNPVEVEVLANHSNETSASAGDVSVGLLSLKKDPDLDPILTKEAESFSYERNKLRNEIVPDLEGNFEAQSVDAVNIDYCDPSTWQFPLSEVLKYQMVEKGPCRKLLDKYPAREDGRRFNKSLFARIGTNKDKQLREWLLYSESTNSVFCFPCCLFTSRGDPSPFSNYGQSYVGFSDFHNLIRGIESHEQSKQHFASVITWRGAVSAVNSTTSLVNVAKSEYRREVSLWKEILRSILDAVVFLSKNNLAFRGATDKLGESGCGNFLSLLELLSHYHPPLAVHIERVKNKKGTVSYMSPGIQNEFISLAAGHVRNNLIKQIKTRKYFSILLDATPDISKQEQISQIVRSVDVGESECTVSETFIDFIHFDKKTGSEISAMIIRKLETDGFNIMDCRGQGYDNGSNMSGIYNGVQAHLKQINPLAAYIPCAAHSLNLVGQNAAKKVLPAKLILGQIQSLYVFFSSSTGRWNLLKTNLKRTLKSQSETRWSSKASALRVICSEFVPILETLNEIINSEDFNAQTMAEATAMLSQISNFKFILGMIIWDKILGRIDIVTVALQKKQMDIEEAKNHLAGLLGWLSDFECTGYDECMTLAKELASDLEIDLDSGFNYRQTRNRLPARFRHDTSQNQEGQVTNQSKFKLEFFDAVLQKIKEEMSGRFNAINSISSDFNFLWGAKLSNNSTAEIIKAAMDLSFKYNDDLNREMFVREVEFLKSAVAPFLPTDILVENSNALTVLNVLTAHGLKEQFVNCHIALRIFLTLPVTVGSNERVFSKLKIVKNYRRSTMGQERLSNLAILSIEHDAVSQVSFEDLLENFCTTKCRKVFV